MRLTLLHRIHLLAGAAGPLLALLLILPPTQARQKLTIGLIPEVNVFVQMQRYQPLADYLARGLDMEVELTMMSRYANVIEHLRNRQIDAAFLGSFTAALAIDQLGAEPLARPVLTDEDGTDQGQIIVRRDSGIKTAGEMRGKVIAFVDPASTAGYLFPLVWLREQGINDYRAFFREYFFAGSHDAAIDAVLSKQADVGATKKSVLSTYLAKYPEAQKQLAILATSRPVPTNSFFISSGIDSGVREKIRALLMTLHTKAEGHAILASLQAKQFISVSVADYSPVMDMVRQVWIDLMNYSAEEQ